MSPIDTSRQLALRSLPERNGYSQESGFYGARVSAVAVPVGTSGGVGPHSLHRCPDVAISSKHLQSNIKAVPADKVVSRLRTMLVSPTMLLAITHLTNPLDQRRLGRE
jgi:hypothetical protein